MLVATWLVSWSSPVHVVLNVLATVVWVAAAVDLLRTPKQDWYTRRGAVLMLIAVLVLSVYVNGVFIPIGAIGWFGWWRGHGGLGLLPPPRPSLR